MALVAVLALLVLALALVAGTFSAGRSMSRAAMTSRAAARADAGARRALASVIVGWEESLDSLPTGASVARSLSIPNDQAPPLVVNAWVRRLGGRVFLVVVDARVSARTLLLARRRYRLLVEHTSGRDSIRRAPTPSMIVGWSLDETN